MLCKSGISCDEFGLPCCTPPAGATPAVTVRTGRRWAQLRSKRSVKMSERVVSMNDVKSTFAKDLSQSSQSSELSGNDIGNAFNMMPLSPQFVGGRAQSIQRDVVRFESLAVPILTKLDQQAFQTTGQQTHAYMTDT